MRIPALIPACTAALSGVLLLPAVALAANGERTPLDLDGEATTGGGAAQVGAGGGSIVRTIVGLAVVIAVIYGLTWAGTRSSNRISGWRVPSPAWKTFATRSPWPSMIR